MHVEWASTMLGAVWTKFRPVLPLQGWTIYGASERLLCTLVDQASYPLTKAKSKYKLSIVN